MNTTHPIEFLTFSLFESLTITDRSAVFFSPFHLGPTFRLFDFDLNLNFKKSKFITKKERMEETTEKTSSSSYIEKENKENVVEAGCGVM